jgi:hypothetical protein
MRQTPRLRHSKVPVIKRPTHPLRSLRLEQSLKEDEILGLLNGPQQPAELLKFGLLLSPTAPILLRRWVDEWLDSGRDATGTDRPNKRALFGGAAQALLQYSKTGLSFVIDSKGQAALRLAEPTMPTDKTPLDKPTFSALALSDPNVPLIPHWEIARRFFVFAYLSPLGSHLAKCRADGCGRYFTLKQTSRPYPGGTLCEAHSQIRRSDKMKTSMKREREKAKLMLWQLAAKRFGHLIRRGEAWYADAKLKASVSAYLNEEIENSDDLRRVYRNGVTGKWLALKANWEGIQALLAATPSSQRARFR